MTKTRTKIITTPATEALEEVINDELDRLEKEGYFIESVTTDQWQDDMGFPRYAGTIIFTEEVFNDFDRVGFNIDFGTGESSDSNPSK